MCAHAFMLQDLHWTLSDSSPTFAKPLIYKEAIGPNTK